ncbi:receptor-recognizing protein [Vibrio phage 207E48.1]|nr:receptor-recognizing protein [Vibrio phage 207E48.1]
MKMAETKKPFYTANGLIVKGNTELKDNLAIAGTLSFSQSAKLTLLRHSNTTGIQDEVRINGSTGDLEVFDTSWKSAFSGGLQWDAVSANFTILRYADNKRLVVPYIHETTGYLKNVGFYEAEDKGTVDKTAFSRKDHNNDGIMFITDGVALVGNGKKLLEIDPTSFRLKYGVGGTDIFVANSTGVVSKVKLVTDETFEAKKAASFGAGLTVTSGDLDISTGRITAGGNVVAFSDERIKSDFKPIEDALERILSMEGGTYHNQVTGAREVGLKAQQVRQAIKEAVVSTGKDVTLMSGEEVENVLAVAYGNLAGLWTEGFREVHDRLLKLEELSCSKDQNQ